MQRAYLTASAALRCPEARSADGVEVRRRNEIRRRTLHSRARNVSPPSHRKASEPLLQERADARERATALRYDACKEVPGMGHARPHLDFDVASRRFQFLGHADRVVA